MNKVIRNTSWMSAGLLLTLLCGAPALADDTELLLIDPNNAAPKPNILLVIDSSGSMTTIEDTKEPYDSTLPPYLGTCDPTMLYWTEVSAVPDMRYGVAERLGSKAAAIARIRRNVFPRTRATSSTDEVFHWISFATPYRISGTAASNG